MLLAVCEPSPFALQLVPVRQAPGAATSGGLGALQPSPVDELLSMLQPELDRVRARQQEYMDLMQPQASTLGAVSGT